MTLYKDSIYLPISLLLINSMILFSQGICIPDPIKTQYVEGHVSFVYGEKIAPLEHVTVEVSEYKYEKRIIAQVDTDKNGFFSIPNIKPGRYWLSTKHKSAIGISVEMKVLRLNKKDPSNDLRIQFNLGGDPSKACGGGHVTTSANKQ